MGTSDWMQVMIAGYLTSPNGQQALLTYLSSPEGKAALDTFLATPAGQQMARMLLLQELDHLGISADAKAILRTALEAKT